MPTLYRIYSVSERDVITGAFDHEFACDQDAVDQARCCLAAYPVVEIWDAERLVRDLGRRLGALFAFESTDRGLTFRLKLPAA